MSPPLEFERVSMRCWIVKKRNDDGAFRIGTIRKDMFDAWLFRLEYVSTALASIQLNDIAMKIRELEELEG